MACWLLLVMLLVLPATAVLAAAVTLHCCSCLRRIAVERRQPLSRASRELQLQHAQLTKLMLCVLQAHLHLWLNFSSSCACPLVS